MWFSFEKILASDVKISDWKIKSVLVDLEKKTTDIALLGYVSRKSLEPVLEQHVFLGPDSYPLDHDENFEKKIADSVFDKIKGDK